MPHLRGKSGSQLAERKKGWELGRAVTGAMLTVDSQQVQPISECVATREPN